MVKIQIHHLRWKLESYIVVVLLMLLSGFVLPSPTIIKHPPKMVRQPPSNKELLFQVDHTESEKPFVIECEAEGIPLPKYTWHKDGKLFNNDGISQQLQHGTLVIKSPKENDSGQYQCFAANELGVATSNSVFVRKFEFNNFIDKDPTTITLDEYLPASLTCQPPQSYPKATVLWIKHDLRGNIQNITSNRITFDPEGTLWFSYITRDDQSNDFTYSCAIMSSFRNEYKIGNRVYLKVNKLDSLVSEVNSEPKKQFVSRKNTIVLKENTLDLWCIFSGKPLPEVKWVKKNGILPADRVEYKNHGKRLMIKNVTFNDEGTYECKIKNGIGTPQFYIMNVNVQSIPCFTVEPEIQNKSDGETAIFKCEAEGLPRPKIIWTYNSHPLGEKLHTNNMEITTNMIKIYNLTKLDTGNYGCNATNENGYVYKDVYLNVLALSPEILVTPTDVWAVKDSDVTMTCNVFGIPKPKVTWFRDGNELTGQRFSISDNGNLLIKAVNFTDSGNYSCHAVNKFGDQTSNGSLQVKRRTEVTVLSNYFVVAAGSSVTLRCNVVSDAALNLSVEWMFDNKTIDFDRESRIAKLSDNSLKINKTKICDSGIYACVASTELDEAQKLVTVLVRGVNDSYISVENTTLSEEWDRPGKPNFSWGYENIKTGGHAIIITPIPDETNPGTFFFAQYRRYGESEFVDSRYEFNEDFLILNDLDLNQLYEVRVVAVNGLYCTTSDIKEMEITAVVASAVTQSASLSWTLKGWLIGMMATIVLFLLILVIICVIKRKRCGTYTLRECNALQDKEDLYAGEGFMEYSQSTDAPKKDSKDSSNNEVRHLIESDRKSMTEISFGKTGVTTITFVDQNDCKKEEVSCNGIAFVV